jgi:phenylacetate-CoA ligase
MIKPAEHPVCQPKEIVMGIHTALVANILFPLQEKLKKHDTVAIRQAMDDSQWWPAEKLEHCAGTTARLAHKAGKHVAYRDCFKNLGFDPKNRITCRFQKLPFW